MKRNKIVITVISLILCSSLLFGCSQMSDGEKPIENDKNYKEQGQVEFWSANNFETILRDKSVSEYANVKQNAEINIEMAKNEYEGAQFFLTAKSYVHEYNVEASDLKTKDGKVFSVENIEVYGYKYVNITNNLASHRGIGRGYYPDALIPIEKLVEFEENTITAGENQGVYVNFHTPEDCLAGLYEGSLKVTYDRQTFSVPVSLKVWDVTVPTESSLQTIFLVGWDWAEAENDSTIEKYKDYLEVMKEHRLSVQEVVPTNTNDQGEEFYQRYAQEVYEYASDPRTSAYVIAYHEASSVTINSSEYAEIIVAIAEKSFEKNFNCLTKAICNFNTIIDEATMQGKLTETIETTNDYRIAIQNAYAKVLANKNYYISEYGVSEDFFEEVADTVKNLKHLFVSNYNEDYAPYINGDETGSGLWCPNVWEFQSDEKVKNYIDNLEITWWYGCGGSSRSIPSYQTDDYTLSPRIMSWQQLYYGITGNLYWAVDYHYTNNGGVVEKEDYFDNPITIGGVNGDGVLTYPGMLYESEYPFSTRRLEAIRDGMEDYELLLQLKNAYSQISTVNGFADGFDNLYSFLTSELFDGININASGEQFKYSRNLYFQLLELANSSAQLSVTDLEITVNKLSGNCFVKTGYSLTMNGQELPKTSVSGGNIYSFDMDLVDYVNNCELVIPELSSDNKLSFVSNGKNVFYSLSEASLNQFKNGFVTINKSLVEKTQVDANALSDKLIKIDVNAAVDTLQSFKVTNDTIKAINNKVTAIMFRIYNNSGATQILSIESKYTGDSIIVQLKSVELKPGLNEITISGFNQKNWNSLKSIDYLQFVFGATTNEPPVNNLYFDGYYVTYIG